TSVRVLLLEAADSLLAGFPAHLQKSAVRELSTKRVEVRLKGMVQDYDGKMIRLADGTRIPARTVLWSAGVQAASLMGKLGLEQVHSGRVRVLPTLQLPEHPDVYVIGDAAYLEEHG